MSYDMAMELVSAEGGEWYAQVRRAGVRLRIYAGRDRGWCVTRARSDDTALPEHVLEASVTAAVHAVRAIPELRWAAVDLVVPKSQDGEWARPLVEGMASRPSLAGDHHVIAGSLREFVRWMASSAAENELASTDATVTSGPAEESEKGGSAEIISTGRGEEPGPVWPSGFESHLVRQIYGAQRLSSGTIATEAWRRGLSVQFTGATGVTFTVSDGDRNVAFNGSRSSFTTKEAHEIVEDKDRALALLRGAGVPVPMSQVVPDGAAADEVVDLADRDHQWPVVVKPARGSMGRGVFVNITTAEGLREYYEHLRRQPKTGRILLEDHVAGDDYRIYVVGDSAVGACLRVPAHVIGDGAKDVKTLIREKNSDRRRNPFLSKGLIRPDIETERLLDRQNLTMSDVPEVGQHVQLRDKANASAGGDSEDVTDDLPQEVLRSAVAAVQAIPGLAAAGVDVLYDRATGKYVVIELNARAHIGLNMYPTRGQGRPVPTAIIDHFFPESTRGSESTESLALNIDDLLVPLNRGSASAVTVAPLPDHLYPVRRYHSFEPGLTLTDRQVRLLARAARQAGVSGGVRYETDAPRLVVAGTSESVRDFTERAERLLNRALVHSRRWPGVVFEGFFIAPRLPLLLPGEHE
ncbi:hypothetical protein BCY76_016460 [Nesterenkonia sp. PF2B19]|nr:hypothetical protein BCY76_016460 [Nesterenkonia sp. PF2B19]